MSKGLTLNHFDVVAVRTARPRPLAWFVRLAVLAAALCVAVPAVSAFEAWQIDSVSVLG